METARAGPVEDRGRDPGGPQGEVPQGVDGPVDVRRVHASASRHSLSIASYARTALLLHAAFEGRHGRNVITRHRLDAIAFTATRRCTGSPGGPRPLRASQRRPGARAPLILCCALTVSSSRRKRAGGYVRSRTNARAFLCRSVVMFPFTPCSHRVSIISRGVTPATSAASFKVTFPSR